MNKYRLTAGVAAVLMGTATPAVFFDADTVSCEKVYDVRLSAETVEIDINDIPENREVQVGINLDNNPGMQSVGFWIRKDSRLSYDELLLFEFDRSKRGIQYGFYDNGNVIETSAIPNIDFDSGELTYDSGLLLKIKLVLPENVSSGDFFEVTPLIEYYADDRMKQAGFYRANTFDDFFGKENFADPVSGGIRITGQKNEPEPSKEPEPSPSPSPEQKPSDQQAGNNNNSQPSSDNNSDKKQETQAVTSAVSETVSTSVSETVDTSGTVSETSVSESETAVTSVSETEVTDETTMVSETTVTEAVTEEKKENKNRSKYLAGVALIAAILGGIGAYSIRRKKK